MNEEQLSPKDYFDALCVAYRLSGYSFTKKEIPAGYKHILSFHTSSINEISFYEYDDGTFLLTIVLIDFDQFDGRKLRGKLIKKGIRKYSKDKYQGLHVYRFQNIIYYEQIKNIFECFEDFLPN